MVKLDSAGDGGGAGVDGGVRYESVVIVGSGVFGCVSNFIVLFEAHVLTTALSLSLHNSQYSSKTKITVIDRHPFPAPDGSSIDSSRIVRADYKDPHYASLCLAAQARWRAGTGVWDGLGSDGRYTESGLVMVMDKEDAGIPGEEKLGGEEMAKKVVELNNKEEIRGVCGTNGGGSGVEGYVNWLSGWADAKEAMRFVRKRCEERGDIEFLVGEVVSLVEMPSGEVKGVGLKDGSKVMGELTVMAYVKVTKEEEEKWKCIPVMLNITTGLFLLPPRNGICKVARHGIGYLNTQPVKLATGQKRSGPVHRSTPMTAHTTPSVSRIPAEGEVDLRRALREMLPALGDRPFESTRICCGHAFKFLPVLGDVIVDIMLGRDQGVWKNKWRWRKLLNTVEE
ncbi:hypothetical protein BGX38DRAFT_1281077 [Terfezia claveryi]|nr:hypothetical protein BGX38DRAFT_1281077 [Terfezia claveryi]